MKKMIEFSIKHPVSVLMGVLALVICGMVSVFSIKIDFLPQIKERHLLVSTGFEGISADEMQTLVTIPVENAVAGVKGIKACSSVTRDGQSFVTVELHWATDSELALTECRELLDVCFEGLPAGCEKPSVRLFSPAAEEAYMVFIEPKDGDLKYCRYLTENNFKLDFQRLEGISEVNLTGGLEEEIQIVADKAKMESVHLTMEGLSETISLMNIEYPAGSIFEGEKEYLFKTKGLFENLDQIIQTPVFISENGIIRLGDIAEVKSGHAEKKSFFMKNGVEGICLGIYKKAEASPVSVSRSIKEKINELNNLYGSYFEFSLINDKSEQLRTSVKQVLLAAVTGILITLLILLIFFRSLKISLLAACMIPLSVLVSIFALAISGKTLNLLSLAGIGLGIGMVIDPACVVIESIVREKSVYKGVCRVSSSTIGSAVTTVVVFIPFFFMDGLSGILFSDMAVSVIAAILSSAVLALTFVPAVYSLMGEDNSSCRELKISFIETKYQTILNHFFEKTWIKYAVLGGCILVSVILICVLKKELLPSSYSESFRVIIDYPEGTSVAKLEQDSIFLFDELKKSKEIKSVMFSGGLEANSEIRLSKPEEKKEALRVFCNCKKVKAAKRKVENLLLASGMKFSIIDDENLLEKILSVDASSFIVFSDDEESVVTLAKEVCESEEIIPYCFSSEQIFEIDRTACSKYSVSASNVAGFIKNTLDGIFSTAFYKEGREIPVKLIFPENSITTTDQLLSSFILAGENYIPLSVLGKFSPEVKEKILFRYNGNASKKVRQVKSDYLRMEELICLKDIQVKELFGNTGVLLCIIILLLYCVMGIQFESFFVPFLLLVAIPPSFSGAFLFLFVFGQTININSVIALVVLFGTSVNNAILLFEAIYQKLQTADTKKICYENRRLVIDACGSRLRSILITTCTTVGALVPFAVDPLHKNPQSSMSIAIIGGLIFSLVIVLFVFPPLLSEAKSGGKNEK